MLYRLCLALFLLGAAALPASAATDIGRVRVDPTPSKTWQDLVRQSELIVVAQIGNADQSVATGRTIREGKLVNYVQTLQIKQVLKGSLPRRVKLVSTGVEPMPDASSPLNRLYPGELAPGDYVLFLHSIAGIDLYSTKGLWQGVYPLFEGHTVALEAAGFSELHRLTIGQLTKKIRSVSP